MPVVNKKNMYISHDEQSDKYMHIDEICGYICSDL